jgi:hypothetical protein
METRKSEMLEQFALAQTRKACAFYKYQAPTALLLSVSRTRFQTVLLGQSRAEPYDAVVANKIESASKPE